MKLWLKICGEKIKRKDAQVKTNLKRRRWSRVRRGGGGIQIKSEEEKIPKYKRINTKEMRSR